MFLSILLVAAHAGASGEAAGAFRINRIGEGLVSLTGCQLGATAQASWNSIFVAAGSSATMVWRALGRACAGTFGKGAAIVVSPAEPPPLGIYVTEASLVGVSSSSAFDLRNISTLPVGSVTDVQQARLFDVPEQEITANCAFSNDAKGENKVVRLVPENQKRFSQLLADLRAMTEVKLRHKAKRKEA